MDAPGQEVMARALAGLGEWDNDMKRVVEEYSGWRGLTCVCMDSQVLSGRGTRG
jgi:hypothetical protein